MALNFGSVVRKILAEPCCCCPRRGQVEKLLWGVNPRECPCWAFTGSRISLQHQGCNLSSNSQWASYLQWLGRKILKHAGFQVTERKFDKSCGVGPRSEPWCCSIVWTWLISGHPEDYFKCSPPSLPQPSHFHGETLIILAVWLGLASALDHTTFSKVQLAPGFPIPVLSFKQLFRPAQS